MDRIRRAPAIALGLRQKVGRYKLKHPQATIAEIAEKFNITVNQARNSINGYRSGKYSRAKPRSPKPTVDNIELELELPAEKTLERQYRYALLQLNEDTKMPADERIAALDKLSRINKTIQDAKIFKHLKSGDSAIITAVVRRYEPEADNDRIITVIKEEYERWKISQQ